jgi:hypothetical protein
MAYYVPTQSVRNEVWVWVWQTNDNQSLLIAIQSIRNQAGRIKSVEQTPPSLQTLCVGANSRDNPGTEHRE